MLKHYEIMFKLKIFMTDNVDSNNTAIAEILKITRSDLTVNEIYDCCLNYIINLAVKIFLFKKKTDAFKTAVDSIDDLILFESELMRKT